ncbi:class I SAM-dependent methyltransferase [Natronosalvus halobius]|uniref:class I SAM-dependent methyltransferase n=1 Tax=Natronosalvus halobius TaxID=2953746 RepID=UPI00209CE559|nr:class I SAM-dependent methyltransferase [Natronosalvus halobius]USZ73270.1 class I SAM-dependent methyltransferase [Natronosalvus halobius]
MTDEERRRWNDHYEDSTHRSPGDPSAVLEAFVDDIPAGRALDIATGGGRNARFLAECGWRVDAIDISSTVLSRAREREQDRERSLERRLGINWILADVDRYGFRLNAYDLVTISFFDARDRLPAILDALAPGGVLVYEHYLDDANSGGPGSPGNRYRFEPNELLEACSRLEIRYYAERDVDGERLVTLVGHRPEDPAGGESEHGEWFPTFRVP